MKDNRSNSPQLSDKTAMEIIHRILNRGNNAEVKATPNGGLKIYEVVKTTKTS